MNTTTTNADLNTLLAERLREIVDIVTRSEMQCVYPGSAGECGLFEDCLYHQILQRCEPGISGNQDMLPR